MPRVAIVVGSTRPKRIFKEIAEWVQAIVRDGSGLTFDLVDLVDLHGVGLPFLDETEMAALWTYDHEHTRI